MHRFKDKYGEWALVAGASEGLGAEFARSLAGRGLHLVLLARRVDLLESLAEQIRKEFKVDVKCFKVDLTNINEIQDVVNNIAEQVGLLVYNAAYSPIGYFADIDSESLLKVIDVNVRAPLYLTSELTKPMIERKRGGVILVSSLAGNQGSPKIATYAATKAFSSILSEGLWKEMQKFNIDVVASVAGAIRTPGFAIANNNTDAPGTLDPEQVAEETLNALGKGPVIIPGRFNRFVVFILQRIIGRRQRINIMFKNTKELE